MDGEGHGRMPAVPCPTSLPTLALNMLSALVPSFRGASQGGRAGLPNALRLDARALEGICLLGIAPTHLQLGKIYNIVIYSP